VQRGDFVTVALQGDFGKPRPALVEVERRLALFLGIAR
jgi:hypothetical protein